MGTPLSLSDNEAHFWYVRPEVGDALRGDCLDLLSTEERDQERRFVRALDRQLYLVAHAALRLCLSAYTGVDPHHWTFVRNEYGCPRILSPVQVPPLCFNLSHTEGMIALLFALDREIGVDVEFTERRGDTVEIADSFFAEREVAELRALPVSQQRERFFELWTLKESYIKARGMGLSIPLDQFAFQLDPPSIRLHIIPPLHDRGESWLFHQLKLTPGHQAAAAMRLRSGEQRLAIAVRALALDRALAGDLIG